MVTCAGIKEASFWVFRWFVAPIVALGLILLALTSSGFGKTFPIGGLLRRLFGKEAPERTKAEVASSLDPERVDPAGNLIPLGTPDAKGFAQFPVVPIAVPDVFDDPETVTFTTPAGVIKTVDLPKGVTSDKVDKVDKVLIITPSVVVVTVKDSSTVKAATVDELLERYSKEGVG